MDYDFYLSGNIYSIYPNHIHIVSKNIVLQIYTIYFKVPNNSLKI